MKPASQQFDSLYAAFETKTKQIQARILRNADLIQEAQQTMWMRVWQQLQAGERIVNPAGYLSSAARNEALQIRESRATDQARNTSIDEMAERENDGETAAVPFDVAERPEDDPAGDTRRLHNALRTAVDLLPPKVQEVVSRHYFGGQPVDQIAREMGISKSTVTSHLVHGRNALKGMFTRSEKVA